MKGTLTISVFEISGADCVTIRSKMQDDVWNYKAESYRVKPQNFNKLLTYHISPVIRRSYFPSKTTPKI